MITIVLGCRPNVVKAAPIVRELQKRDISFRLLHTGQHRGDAMFDQIMRDLKMPVPVSSPYGAATGSHTRTTATAMLMAEHDLTVHRPDWLVVLGDVNSTLGAALAAAKMGVKIAHVEAGYRSNDWEMPEEVNRVLVDRMSALLLCPDNESGVNSMAGRKPGAKAIIVGNVMMDSLRWALNQHRASTPIWMSRLPAKYAVLTVHRPSNVDTREGHESVAYRLQRFAEEHPGLPIVWPCHPRARAMLASDLFQHARIGVGIDAVEPLGYLDMVALLRDCWHVITDSGGVLEEALYLGKPVTSLRDPLKNERQHLLDNGLPPIWKTDAAPRIVDALLDYER